MRIAWTMVLALTLVAVGCKEEEKVAPPVGGAAPEGVGQPAPTPPPAAPADTTPPTIGELRTQLAAAGVNVTETKPLPGHTMPMNCNEEWRQRIYFGAQEFLNVNRFPDPAAAQACMEEYKQAVAKGGQAALDRLMPLNSVEGRYLLQFSEAMTDAKRREAILATVKATIAAEPAPAPGAQPGAAPSAPATP